MLNDARAGWTKFLLHFLGFGVPFGTVAWFGGWGTAAVLVAWRSYEEFLDFREHRDTLGKALVDLLAQVSLTVAVAVVRSL